MELNITDLLAIAKRRNGQFRPSEPLRIRLATPEQSYSRNKINSRFIRGVAGCSVILDLDDADRLVTIELLPDPTWTSSIYLS